MDWSRTHGRNRTVEVRKDKDMKYPMINKQPRREVNVPELSGGLNLRDSLSGIRDNQMTDCVNMWYKEGMLRTRPGFVTNGDMYITSTRVYEDVYVSDLKTHGSVKKGNSVLVSCIECDGSFENGAWLANVGFYWQDTDKMIQAGYVEFDGIREESCKTEKELEEQIYKSSRTVFEKDGYIYLLLNENGKSFRTYKSKIDDELKWNYINKDEYYIPTVYAHCLPTNNGKDFTGTQFESHNVLCEGYKMVYSLYNPTNEKHNMAYKLAGISFKESYVIEALIIGPNGEEDRYVVKTSSEIKTVDSETINGRRMTAYINEDYQHILFSTDGDYQNNLIELTEKDNYAEDNLIITITPSNPYKNKSREKIFKMSQSVWFGGAANGINGGSRLFLCGNTDENEKSLVVWSALNNPLYFPENNYAYVGDKSQGVTAFGQQGENLIIFKEKSSYYSYYTVNNNITADALISQSVVDYEANSAIFPMIQLNANIGCDCPDTVQLCRNRLVWANSDGNVYTLCSNNQYSERTIFKVSDMVSTALKRENDLKNAVSCDFEGHYLLCVGNRIYVMDYNSYGYQYVSSFSKNEDSNEQIPWYIWAFDSGEYGEKIFAIDNSLMIARNFQTNSGVTMTFSTLLNGANNGCDLLLFCNSAGSVYVYENKIKSIIKTKLFDFSSAGYLKNVDRVSIAFGNNGGEPISVGFLTDKGSESDVVTLAGSSTDERDAAFVTAKNFYPGMKSVRTFGVKIECEGPLIVDGLSLQYRLLGSVK